MDAVGGFWDTAPGLVIVPEAGGLIVNIEGKTPTADDHVVLATNGEEDLHEDLCGLMFDCYQGYDGFR
jgi:fructose-1,6-bisphosphatase/inositol monophosphatase family enzyme